MKQYKTDEPLTQVVEFHTTYKHPIKDVPQTIGLDRGFFRAGLIQEELDELKEAILDGNLVEIADALVDLQYVVNGAFCEFGLSNLKDKLCKEVHSSNMSKLCKSVEEAQAYIDLTTTEDGPTAEYEVLENGDIVLYSLEKGKEGKVLKGPHYFKPDLKSIINNE